jgi:hypothetical protein
MSLQLVDKIFNQLDKNYDAMISFEEFQAGYAVYSNLFQVSGESTVAARLESLLKVHTALMSECIDLRDLYFLWRGRGRPMQVCAL